MKKVIFMLSVAFLLSSCRRFNSTYEQRLKGVREVIPNGMYVRSEGMNIAIDTASNPNKIYHVWFCNGWVFPTYKVKHLVKIN